MKSFTYPFGAIVGQESMKTALLLNAVDPTLGGVLIRGQKGTAKSTAARGLARLLPSLETVEDCPFQCPPEQTLGRCAGCVGEPRGCRRPTPVIDLPLGATEDRVIGTLNLEAAIQEGRRRFEPGLLAAAHRGILYVDEVNLLEDHLVDVLLDAAAMGVNLVEREGLSVSHPARFVLVGTMNPEEGELRPQFLDRFGLCVEVVGLESAAERAEVIRRRLRYEADPRAFVQVWEAEERRLTERIVAAQALLPAVVCADALLDTVARLTVQMGVHGHRADLAMVKTARALAAFDERAEVTEADVRAAAALVLPHRLESTAQQKSPLSPERREELMRHGEAQAPGSDGPGKKKTTHPNR